ncbi:MAG: flagellar export protein FliJ [Fimbriimonadales bacterium]
MKKFRFRLQKVLEYREAMEHWAQEAYLETRVARLEGDATLLEIRNRRAAALQQTPSTLEERKELERTLQMHDEDERGQEIVVEILATEEAKALDAWQEKKRELETISKLRDKALEEWLLDERRHDQSELDEWSVLRRGA